MKTTQLLFVLGIVIIGCQARVETEPNETEEAFIRNAEVVKSDIEGWESEQVDYSIYSDNYMTMSTVFGAPKDTTTLEEMKAQDAQFLALFDFELVSDLVLLPGVNGETKKMDGSVRYYGEWKVTKPATDSTAERSGVIAMYSTYEFNDEGKIISSVGYGDFSGLMAYLNSDKGDESDDM